MATTPVSPAANAAPDVSAPAMPTGAPATPAGGFDAAFDSVFGGGEAAPTTVDGAPAAPGEEAAPPADVVPEGGEEIIDDAAPDVANAAPEPAVEEEVDPYADIQPDKVDGKFHHYRKNKAQAMEAAYKTVRSIREIDPTLDVDSIRSMYDQTLEWNRMLSDYESGDPQTVAGIVPTFINEQQNPASVAAFADNVVAEVSRINPQAYRTIQNKMLLGIAQQQFQLSRTAPDPNDRAAAKAIAQNLQYLAIGRFDDPDAAPAAQHNPLAPRLQALEGELQRYRLQSQQSRESQIAAAVKAAEADAQSTVDQSIESALAVIPAEVRNTRATEYRHAVRDLKDAFEEAKAKNPAYQKQYDLLMAQMRTNPTDQARNALKGFVKQWADHAIGRAAGEVRARFTKATMQANTAAHKPHEAVQQRKEPAANGAPVQRATLTQKLKDPNLSYADKMDLYFKTLASR